MIADDPATAPNPATAHDTVSLDAGAAPSALAGLRILELGGIGPVPFTGMWFADHGARVTRIERPGGSAEAVDPLLRGRRSVALDLRRPDGRAIATELIADADVLLEGFRPGVAERLGLGPNECTSINPRLVYVRLTGWGQAGPLANRAGHDITYLALTGALWSARRSGSAPVPPLNLLGDFGGGAMFAICGALTALLERQHSGRGQVVDAAIIDGIGLFTTFVESLRAQGRWTATPGANLLDTGAPFYEVYECADGQFVAVGALEPAFYEVLLERSGALAVLGESDAASLAPDVRTDPAVWPAAKRAWATVFGTRTRDEWAEVFADTDGCVVPVLSPAEASQHPHNVARHSFRPVGPAGAVLPAPAPRLSRTPPRFAADAGRSGRDTDAVLGEIGRTAEQIARLRAEGTIG